MVRDDGGGFLNMDFGGGSPSSTCGLGADNFSVRWTRTVNFTVAGVYRFIATIDNGLRLYVDGQLKIDQWGNLPLNTYTADVNLSAGLHEIKLEFVEYGGAAAASLSWANCVANVPANRWKGEYFNNTNLSGSPAMVRDDGDGLLNFNLDFGGASPSSACGVVSDNFSARWTRMVTFFANGVFRFSATVDNGVRLYVDGQLKIDKWAELPPNTYTADVALTEGDHEVKLEFVEYTGSASVNLSWTFVGSADCIDIVPADRWKGEYFNNSTFTSPSGLVRDHGDGFLDYQLSQCPPCGPNPSCGLGGSFFSARYTRTINFARGSYRFFLSADAAARLYVDGQLKVDNPFSATGEVDVALSAGAHEVKVEYVANGFPHEVSLSWETICSVNVPAGRWKGDYYNNTNLSGSPAMTLDDGDGFLNINFGNDSPGAACGLGADNFSARWTRTVNFAPGPYRFTVTVDDGARLYIDGQLIINKWFLQAPTTYTADAFLSGGAHEIKLEYFEGVGAASISLSWSVNCLATVPADRWKGEYFNNTNLAGSPAIVSDNGGGFLNLNFGNDSPGAACGLGADNFSARWTRTVNFAPGSYRFTVTVDDGARLYVDGELIIDKWLNQPPTTYMAERALSAGAHEIKLEYFEGAVSGVAILSWGAAAGLSCLPDVPLIGVAPRAGGGEIIATTSIPKANKRCGQKNPEPDQYRER